MASAKPIGGGNIEIRLIKFVTPDMLAVTGVVGIIVFLLWDMFASSFNANIYLNGTIIGVIIYSLFKVYKNNYDAWVAAKYIQEVEEVEQTPDFAEEDVDRLIKRLKGPGSLYDMQNTYTILRNMRRHGFFCVTDKDSMLIKSKIGARIRNKRNAIAFYATILVTLGLIGTFWGLIVTITAVGEAMGDVSAKFAGGGDAGSGMGDIIAGISKPLEGMGVAFSSSLFGLAGSLMLGILNFLGGRSQDKFMENVARWLDEHIPQLNPELHKKAGDVALPPKQDTDALLGAFVVLSQDTHKHLRAFAGQFEKMGGLIEQQVESNKGMEASQLKLTDSVSRLTESQAGLSEGFENIYKLQQESGQQISGMLTTLQQAQTGLGHELTNLGEQLGKFEGWGGTFVEQQSQYVQQAQVIQTTLGEQLKTLQETQGTHTQELQEVRDQSAALAAVLHQLLGSQKQLKETLDIFQSEPFGGHTSRLEKLVGQIQNALDDEEEKPN